MELKNQVFAVMRKAVEKGDVAGANVLVLKDGKEVLYCDCGYRDLENRIPMSRDTILRMYSMSKPITSAAVMSLAAKGEIDLAAPVADYLPEFAESFVNEAGVRCPAARQIAVCDLMNMTSGLPYGDAPGTSGEQVHELFEALGQRLYTENPMTTEEFSRAAAKIDLAFHPGTQFRYGISADILGAMVERVSGMRFGEYLRETLFDPLGMEDTGFYVPAEKRERLAKVYSYSENGLVENRTDALGVRYLRDADPGFESGGAGLCSTLDDYMKFGTMLLCDGSFQGRQILPAAAVRFMRKGGLTEAQKLQQQKGWFWQGGYGYGNLMRVCEDENLTRVFASKGEYGWDGWLGTFFSNEPAHGITMVFGTQQESIGRAGTLIRKLKALVMCHLT